MKEEELLAILRLQKTKGVGDTIAKKLIAVVGSVSDIFSERLHLLSKIDGIGSQMVFNLSDESNLKMAEKELEFIHKNKIEYSYFFDDDYPNLLKQCVDGPILFFKDGNMDLTNPRMISVVGTRNMTNYGKEICEKLISGIRPYNPVIVSGFAYGVDICGHKAALENNLQTIAVLAHGLDRIYPKNHKRYMRKIMEYGGFITDFFHKDEPIRENFLKRNRIVAGLSQATIVIESAKKGGSLVTADIANSYNRDVFAVPGKVNQPFSFGCNQLIQQNKATLIQSAEDIVKLLNWDIQEKSKKKIVKSNVQLNENEQKIVSFLKEKEPKLLDVIALETDIPVFQIATILLQLELKGVIKPLPGKLFKLFE